MSDPKTTLLDKIEAAVLNESLPIASALRTCMLLGAKVGSEELSTWARQELKGYEPGVELPEYRTLFAPLRFDYMTPAGTMTGERISPVMLPEEAQSVIDESVSLVFRIGTIEDMAERAKANGGEQKLSPPGAAELAALMTHNFQQRGESRRVMEIYWSVSEVPLRGIVDHVRTLLTELVAELRAAQRQDHTAPKDQDVQNIVNVVIGGKARVGNVNTNQATNNSQATIRPDTPEDIDSPGWSMTKKVWSFSASAAVILGTFIALMVWRPWH